MPLSLDDEEQLAAPDDLIRLLGTPPAPQPYIDAPPDLGTPASPVRDPLQGILNPRPYRPVRRKLSAPHIAEQFGLKPVTPSDDIAKEFGLTPVTPQQAPPMLPLAPGPAVPDLGGLRVAPPATADQDYQRYLTQFQSELEPTQHPPPGKQLVPLARPDFDQLKEIAHLAGADAQRSARTVQRLIPKDLRGFTPEELAQPGGFINPRTGQQSTVAGDLAADPLGTPVVSGATGIAHGVEQMAEPEGSEKVRGAGKIFAGAANAATPFMLALGVTAPVEAAAWWMISKGVGTATPTIAKHFGANEDDAQEITDVAQALPLLYGFGKVGLRRLGEARAATAEQAAQRFESTAESREQTAIAHGVDPYGFQPVDVTLKSPSGPVRGQVRQIAPAEGNRSPIYQIVEENGKGWRVGDSNTISAYLQRDAADPSWVQKLNQSAPGQFTMAEAPKVETPAQAQMVEQAKTFQGEPSSAPVTQAAPPEAPPPAKVEKPSPETPNAPTAAKPTVPEAPETIAAQMEQLAAGQRKAVMIPKGTQPPTSFPPGVPISITNDGMENTYAYRRDLTTKGAIHTAAKSNKLNELLGTTEIGMGAPDKATLDQTPGEKFTVVVRAADGTEVQSTATDEDNLSTTLAASERLVPAGGSVHIEPAEQVIGERAGATQVEAPSTQVEPTKPTELGAPADLESQGRPTTTANGTPFAPYLDLSKAPPGALEQPGATPEDAKKIRERYRQEVIAQARDFLAQNPNTTPEKLAAQFGLGKNQVAEIYKGQPPADIQTGLDEAGGKMAEAIVGNMRDMLWGRVQAGKTTEGGQPSAVLQAAKLVRDRGGLQTPEEFKGFLADYGAIQHDAQFQQSMRDLVGKYTPAAEVSPHTPSSSEGTRPPTSDTSPLPGPATSSVQQPEDLAAPSDIEAAPPSPVLPNHYRIQEGDKPGVTWLNDDFGNFSLPAGTQLVSKSGRPLAPSPKFDASTSRKRTLSLARQRTWLVDEARKEAAAKGDTHTARIFERVNPNNYPRAEADTVNEYLFGDNWGPTEKSFAKATSSPLQTAPHFETYFKHVTDEFAGRSREALDWVRAGDGRFAKGAIPNPEIEGGIGLLHGYKGDSAPKWLHGFGVAHIDVRRPGFLDRAIEIIPLLPLYGDPVMDKKTGRVIGKVLSDGKHRAVVSLDWFGKDSPAWLLTSYREEQPASATSVSVREAVENGGPEPTPSETGAPDTSVPEDLTAPQSLESQSIPESFGLTKVEKPSTLEQSAADRGTGADSAERRGTDRARAEDTEALASAPPELREEPRREERPVSDRGPGGGRPLGDLQQPEEQGVRSGSGARSGETRLDQSGERSPQAERPEYVRSGDLTAESGNRDFRITAETGVGEGTQRQKLSANLDAIRTVKQLQSEGRPATPEEQHKLARYVGWGGMPQIFDWRKREWEGAREELRGLLTPDEYQAAEASTKNAHYTSPMVVESMWNALQHMGLKPGFTVIEPSMGIGNFFGLQPDSLLPARRTGVELDKITGAIAKALYPDSNVQITGFEKIALPNDFFDIAISNVPFGNYGVYDPKYKRNRVATSSIHNYFFVKSLDLVRPGGVVAFVTSSRYTMDAQATALRQQLADKADLVGMIRLPDSAFKGNAGTEVVTDIIFLRKRPEGQAASGPSFVQTKEVDTADGKRTVVNEYYAKHPDMMLGELRLEGSMYAENQQTLKGELTPEKLQEAVDKLPQGVYKEWKAESPAFEDTSYAQLGDLVKDGGYDVRDGVVVQREGNLYRPVQVGKTAEARIKGLIPVRAALHDVFRTQLEEVSEKEIVAARKKLNQAYDAFVKKFGPINAKGNSNAFGEDPDYAVMAGALEDDYDKETNTAKKAAIFSQRTIEKPKVPDRADKASEALAIVLNERGRLDWDRMQQLTGKTPDEMREELGGIVYQNPDGRRWETQDEYLSGNVREKLELAQEAAKADPKFDRNVEALEKVQPRDLAPEEIRVTLGAPWIPAEHVTSFIRRILDLDGAQVRYTPAVATWSVSAPKWAQARTANTTTYGTPDYYAHELVDLALNGKGPRVWREGPNDTRILDTKATAAAQAAQDALKEKFKEWIWEQPFADALAKKYNREMNNLRLVEHDGSHLTLPGSNAAITLRPHQKNVIWRALKTGNTLLAHEVGAGKTWEMVGIAMESRRLGLAKKPLLVVPNHMAEQVATEFAQLYPAARVLTVGKEDFAAGRRQKAIARIAGGAWDAVIIRHSSFERIPVSDDTFKAFVDSQIEELRAALDEQKKDIGKGADKDKTVKEIQKAISRLEVKLKKRLAREDKDKGASFEQLGVDLMLVDEAHAFKALPIITRRTRVAGIPTRESNRATDMYMKTQYVANLNGGGRGVIFATGTPVTNTMAELYNMQRYLQGKALKAAGVAHFDAWANTFGEVLRGVELDVSGKGFRENERFAKFINVPELMTMYRQVADVKTAEMMKLPRPDLVGGAPQAVTAPESPELRAFVDSLVQRTEKIRGGQVDKTEDNMLKVVSEGKKAALDMRLVDSQAEDRPTSKVNKAVDNIFQIWRDTKAEKATQIVFCDLSTPKAKKTKGKAQPPEEEVQEETASDAVPEAAGERAGFSVYDDMKTKLVGRGIPEREIAFIHDYDSDAKKQELFDAVNAGKVRVIMGSTEKMGVGTNVQKRAIALHHMDAPWRPADIKQRDGRIQRQGNMHKQVHIFQYLTEGSFDAYSWQLLENKARFIGPVLSGELSVREMEDVGMVLPSAAEFKAMASGNPIIKEKIGTDAALGRLDAQRVNFRKQQAGVKSQLASLPSMIESTKHQVSESKADIDTIEKNKDVGFSVGKRKFTGDDARKNAAEALGATLDTWVGPGVPQLIGHYRGLEIWTRPGTLMDSYPGVTVRGRIGYNANVNPTNPLSTLQSIESVVRNVKDRLEPWQRTLDEQTKKFEELKAQEGKTWPHEAKYQELVKRKAEIDAQLAESEAEKAASEKAANQEAKDSSVTLGFGLGALQPALDVAGKAVKDYSLQIALPKVATILRGGKETAVGLAHLVSPVAGVDNEIVTSIFKMKGGREAAQHLLRARLKTWSKRVDKMTQAEMVDFIDRQKTGQPQGDKELQALSDFLRKVDDDLFTEVQRYHPSVNYLENHYRVLWKVIPGSPQAKGGFKGVFKKPLRGSRGFLKQAKLVDMSEGLKLGGVPHTYNPIKNFELHYQDAMKFITAQRMWEEFGNTGVRKFVRRGKAAPDGYTQVNDRIARVYFPVTQGLVDAGDWYVQEGAARLLNNYLGVDHIRKHAAGRFLMWMKNASTSIELSFSPFHAVFEGNEAIGSQLGMGFREIWNLGVLKGDAKAALHGAKTLAGAPGAFYTVAHEGRLAKQAFEDWGAFSQSKAGQAWMKQYPQAKQDFEDFFNAGGIMGQHEDYKTSALAGFKEYWRSASAKDPKNYIAAGFKSIPAFNQLMMKPLFEKYIPNLKLGFYLREYNLAKREYADRIASGEMTLDQLARSVVRSIDNRFGEMNYDNLFWDQTFKTANQLMFRSVTWKLGNLRANADAVAGVYTELARSIHGGGPPKLNMNTSWLLGMSLWTAILGGAITFLATGKRPKELKDLVYPVIDDANHIRVSLPTYWRDLMHLVHSPVGYLTSSLSGEIGRIADIWRNKDFYGNEVYGSDDPFYEKAWEAAKQLFPVPFNVASYRQATKEGGNLTAQEAGYLGFTKAPRYIEQTDAEQLASDYLGQHQEVGARTKAASERLQARAGIRNIYRRGGDASKQVGEAIRQGYMRPGDAPKLRMEARKGNLERMVHSLYSRPDSLGQLLNIYDTASPEERKAIESDVRKKVMTNRLKPYAWNEKTEGLAWKYFKLRPYHPPKAVADLGTPASLDGAA